MASIFQFERSRVVWMCFSNLNTLKIIILKGKWIELSRRKHHSGRRRRKSKSRKKRNNKKKKSIGNQSRSPDLEKESHHSKKKSKQSKAKNRALLEDFKLRQRRQDIIFVTFIFILTIILCNPIGLVILIISTAIGLIPPEKGLPRIHSMGCLLVPIIGYFLIWLLYTLFRIK